MQAWAQGPDGGGQAAPAGQEADGKEAAPADADGVLALARSASWEACGARLAVPDGYSVAVTVRDGSVWVVQAPVPDGGEGGEAQGAAAADEAPEAPEAPAQGAGGQAAADPAEEEPPALAEGAPACALRAWALALALEGAELPDGEASWDPVAEGAEEAEAPAAGTAAGADGAADGAAGDETRDAGALADAAPQAHAARDVTWVFLVADGTCECAFSLPCAGLPEPADGAAQAGEEGAWAPGADGLSAVLEPAADGADPLASWWVCGDAAQAAGDALPAAQGGADVAMPDGTPCSDVGRPAAAGSADGSAAQAPAAQPSKAGGSTGAPSSGAPAGRPSSGSAGSASAPSGTPSSAGGSAASSRPASGSASGGQGSAGSAGAPAGGPSTGGPSAGGSAATPGAPSGGAPSGGSAATPGTPSGGSSSGSTSGGTAASPSAPAKPAEKTWHETKAAWDEQVLVKAAWDEQVLVKDAWDEQVVTSEAWDEQVLVSEEWYEQVIVGSHYVFHYDGYKAYSEDELDAHAWELIQQGVEITSYYVDYDYETVHHPDEYTTVHHDAEYTTVHHDAEGYWA